MRPFWRKSRSGEGLFVTISTCASHQHMSSWTARAVGWRSATWATSYQTLTSDMASGTWWMESGWTMPTSLCSMPEVSGVSSLLVSCEITMNEKIPLSHEVVCFCLFSEHQNLVIWWGIEIKFAGNYFYLENYDILQSEPFLTINLSPLLVTK